MTGFDNITADELRDMYEAKMKDEAVAKYVIPKHPSADGFYRVNVKDPTKKTGRRQITGKTIDELKERLYQYEKGINGSARKTFKEVFDINQTEKPKYRKNAGDIESARSTAKKNQFDYDKFIAGTYIENRYIDEITKKDLESVILLNCQRYNLTKSRFSAMRTVLSSTFKLAYEEYWISDNPYLRINFDKYARMTVEATPIEERVFTDIEIKKIKNELSVIHSKRPKQITAWAVSFTLLVFFRLGEVPPLTWEDIHEKYISVNKEQIKTVDGDYIVVSHTKTKYDRRFPITPQIRLLLDQIKKIHDLYYSDSPYLFPNTDGSDCIRSKAVYDCYKRVCKRCGIVLTSQAKKGIHSFRRIGATGIMQTTHDPELESKLLGHSPEVAKKHYIVNNDYDMEQAVKALEAISS